MVASIDFQGNRRFKFVRYNSSDTVGVTIFQDRHIFMALTNGILFPETRLSTTHPLLYSKKSSAYNLKVPRGPAMKKIIFLTIMIAFFSSAAFASKAAVIFVETDKIDYEKTDWDILNFIDTISIESIRSAIQTSYDQLYELVNADATKDNFFDTLQTAVNEHTTVDLYIVAHGGSQYFWGHFDERIDTDDILGLKGFLNIDHLRLVYIGSCHAWDLTDEFVEAGAKVAVGCDQQMSNYPFLAVFLIEFVLGYSVDTCVTDGATAAELPFKANGDAEINIGTENR